MNGGRLSHRNGAFPKIPLSLTVAFRDHDNPEAGTLVCSASLRLCPVLHLCLRAEKHPAPSVRGILRWKDFHPSCTESESPPCLRQADSLCELQEALQMLARVSHMEGRTLNDKG